MSAPSWMEALVREFGKGAGLPDLAFNDRGAAALSFENGASLRFEYAEGTLYQCPKCGTQLSSEQYASFHKHDLY